MRKIFIAAVALVFMWCASLAMAADEAVTITIEPLDVRTGQAITRPDYNPDQLFKLRVRVNVPRFYDTENLQLQWLPDGVELLNVATDESGYYIVDGVVLNAKASLVVRMKDVAIDNATTAEEMYHALQKDRTATAVYYFYAVATAPNTPTLSIPKTGDPVSLGAAVLCLAGGMATAACVSKKKK